MVERDKTDKPHTDSHVKAVTDVCQGWVCKPETADSHQSRRHRIILPSLGEKVVTPQTADLHSSDRILTV